MKSFHNGFQATKFKPDTRDNMDDTNNCSNYSFVKFNKYWYAYDTGVIII